MKRGATPELRLIWIGACVALLAVLAWRWSVPGGTDRGPVSTLGEETGLSRSLENREALQRPAKERIRRDSDVEAKVRSILQVAPGEVGMVHLSPSGLEKLLPLVMDRKPGEADSVVACLDPDRLEAALADLLRGDENLRPTLNAINQKITCSGDGISVEGEVRDLSATGDSRLHMRIWKTSSPASPVEFISRVPSGSVGLVHLPESGNGGVLVVTGSAKN